MGKKGKTVAAILGGAAIGAGLGILFAPKSGKETRAELKAKMEELDIMAQPDYIYSDEEDVIVSPKIRVVISTYYKGTALDGALKKLEEYIDSSNENTIKAI